MKNFDGGEEPRRREKKTATLNQTSVCGTATLQTHIHTSEYLALSCCDMVDEDSSNGLKAQQIKFDILQTLLLISFRRLIFCDILSSTLTASFIF